MLSDFTSKLSVMLVVWSDHPRMWMIWHSCCGLFRGQLAQAWSLSLGIHSWTPGSFTMFPCWKANGWKQSKWKRPCLASIFACQRWSFSTSNCIICGWKWCLLTRPTRASSQGASSSVGKKDLFILLSHQLSWSNRKPLLSEILWQKLPLSLNFAYMRVREVFEFLKRWILGQGGFENLLAWFCIR